MRSDHPAPGFMRRHHAGSVLAQPYHHRWSMIEIDVQRVRAIRRGARGVAIGEGLMHGDHSGVEPVRAGEEVEAGDALGGDHAPLEVESAGDAVDDEA